MTTFNENITNIYGKKGKNWLKKLPNIMTALVDYWHLTDIVPVDNMSFHFVAKAMSHLTTPIVVKIGCDEKVIQDEMRALAHFSDEGCIQLIDYNSQYNALLLQQAIPGYSLKSIYPSQIEFAMDCYVETMKKLHHKLLPAQNNFIHITEWLKSIDHVTSDQLPDKLLKQSIYLKNNLLKTSDHDIFLHGDLHHDNIIKNAEHWLAIDPKGIIGDPEFEIAAFDFIHSSELKEKDVKKIFEKRLMLIAQKSGLNLQRIRDWVFVRLILSAAWSIEDKSDPSWAISLAESLY